MGRASTPRALRSQAFGSFPCQIETLDCLSQLGKFYLEKMVGFEKSDTTHYVRT
jgi:hypothetical protein